MLKPYFRIFFSFALLSVSCLYPLYSQEKPTTPLHKYIRPIQITENSSGIAGIDCIYVINLDKRVEKWKRVKEIFDQQGLRVNRVSGVNGYIISEDEKRELSGPYPTQLRGTQIGCLLSHISILHDAKKRGYRTIWVMEDDIEFVDKIDQLPSLLQTLSEKDPQWNILYTDVDWRHPNGTYLTNSHYNPPPDIAISYEEYTQPRINITKDLMRIRHRWGTHSMIISKEGIDKIVSYYNTYFLWGPIDADLHFIPGIRQYATTRDIVTNWNKSPISDVNPPITTKNAS